MEEQKSQPKTIDEYIAGCPQEAQPILEKVRSTVKEAAPDAEERISYQMPGFYQKGMVVWFGLHKNHIGFYPTGEGIEAFKEELSGYKTSKGAVQFPLDKPMPYELIQTIVKYWVAQNSKK